MANPLSELERFEQEMKDLGSEPSSSRLPPPHLVARVPLPPPPPSPHSIRSSATLSSHSCSSHQLERAIESEEVSAAGKDEEEEKEKEKKEDLEKQVWRCLNNVHDMLCLREILNHTLRKGWMELASARYEMGPARISHTLFSLKPQAAKAVVDVSPHPAGGDDEGDDELFNKGPVVFELIKDASERGQKVAASADETNSKFRKKNPLSQLRRRPVATPAVQVESADNAKDELLDYANLIDDSDSEDDLKPLEVQKNSLQGFGAMVVPHLRFAQGSFAKALQVIVDVLNAQSNATDAHSKATRLKESTDGSPGQ